MAGKPPAYRTLPTDAPIWVSEPFRVFFPLGIAAGIMGLLLWPLHYAGWWSVYPALQHPRLLIFGFGAAFVFGFLGTAWPRFLESEALRLWELAALVVTWTISQVLVLRGALASADLCIALAMFFLLFVLGRRLFGRESRDLPPPGFGLAFGSVALTAIAALVWSRVPLEKMSVATVSFLRLMVWQGFLLLPLLGVGSYLFSRFFQIPGQRGGHKAPPHRAAAVWGAAGLILVSFAVEAFGWVRTGNLLRLAALAGWGIWAVPVLWRARRAPGTRPWALRIGLGCIALTFLSRAIWPNLLWIFAFEHVLFLGGFGLVMLLTADRVILGHCDDPAAIPPKSRAWRWIAWLMIVALATRATADLVPSTRVSHHIYAALTLTAIFAIWLGLHFRRLKRRAPDD